MPSYIGIGGNTGPCPRFAMRGLGDSCFHHPSLTEQVFQEANAAMPSIRAIVYERAYSSTGAPIGLSCRPYSLLDPELNRPAITTVVANHRLNRVEDKL